MTTCAVAFFFAFVVSVAATVVVRAAGRRWGIVDKPDDYRKIHTRAIPRLGGVAIFLAFCSPVAALCFVHRNAVSELLHAHPLLVGGLVGGGAIALAVGIIDDVRGLSPRTKILLQGVAALAAFFAGYSITRVNNPFGEPWELGLLSLPITLFWFIGCMNAVNLLDGLDGLAAGVCLVASTTLFLVSLLFGNVMSMLFIACLSGAIMGFLLFNFHPASIFLGDSGSVLLGFLIAAVSLVGARKAEATVVLVIPAVALGLPILDTTVAILRRWSRKLPISSADRQHIHHFLLSLGLSQRRVVLILYIACVSLGGAALLIATGRDEVTLFIIGSLGIIAFVCVRVFAQITLNDFLEKLWGRWRDRRRSGEARVGLERSIARMKNEETPEALWQAFASGIELLGFDFARFELRDGAADITGRKKARLFTWSNDGDWNSEIPAGDRWSARLKVEADGHLFGELELGKSIEETPLLPDAPELVDRLRREMAAQLERMSPTNGGKDQSTPYAREEITLGKEK